MPLAKAEGSSVLAENPPNWVPVLCHVVHDVPRNKGQRLVVQLPKRGHLLSRIAPDALLAWPLPERSPAAPAPLDYQVLRHGASGWLRGGLMRP